jgi:hypothetical protein
MKGMVDRLLLVMKGIVDRLIFILGDNIMLSSKASHDCL